MAAPTETKCESKQPVFHPGAAPYGNFINYYSFNPPLRRIDLIPDDLLDRVLGQTKQENHQKTLAVFDVGCNSGVSL